MYGISPSSGWCPKPGSMGNVDNEMNTCTADAGSTSRQCRRRARENVAEAASDDSKTLPDAGVERNRTEIGKIAFDADPGATARSEKGVFT